jgi:adenylate kinase family enzyme
VQVAEHHFNHLSAGDLLRAEIARGSAQGASIKGIIERGQLVPVDVTLALLRQAMRSSRGVKFLVDGFPRAMDQAAAFEAAVTTPTRVCARLRHRRVVLLSSSYSSSFVSCCCCCCTLLLLSVVRLPTVA